jgi:surface antigen
MAAAYSKSDGVVWMVTGDSSSDAQVNALYACDTLTTNAPQDCQGAQWVLNGWLALAEYYTGSSSAPVVHAWGVSAGQTAAAAKANAVGFCNSLDNVPGTACTYIGEASSPATTQSPTYGHPLVGANDYPTYLATPPLDAVVDPWGFYNRECTSFVAWRVNDNNGVLFFNSMPGPRHNGSSTNRWGNASNWKQHATDIGYTYNQTPAARSIAWWPGHVAYVDSVSMSGSTVTGITIEQYNWGVAGSYSKVFIPVGGIPKGQPYPSGFIHGLEGIQLITK